MLKDICVKRSLRRPITMLTAANYSMAVWLARAGVDIILVGDSLANVELGLVSTTQVGMVEMLHHTAAVVRGAGQVPVVGDMPFEAYQKPGADVLGNARRFIEVGCAAVKVEWFGRCLEVVKVLRDGGIEVIGHVGLTPQTAQSFTVQGRGDAAGRQILEQSQALAAAGCVAVVLECVPAGLAAEVTSKLLIPTIGIGAGKECDGQVLVTHDLLGLNDRKVPRFVKKYADAGGLFEGAVRNFIRDVSSGDFPDADHSYE